MFSSPCHGMRTPQVVLVPVPHPAAFCDLEEQLSGYLLQPSGLRLTAKLTTIQIGTSDYQRLPCVDVSAQVSMSVPRAEHSSGDNKKPHVATGARGHHNPQPC